jgi:hypothetical protein
MIRIDVDNYTILYVQYDDHLHRYAIPNYWTVGLMAGHVIDTFDKDKEKKLRRSPNTKYQVYDDHGTRLPPHLSIDAFFDGQALLVKVDG